MAIRRAVTLLVGVSMGGVSLLYDAPIAAQAPQSAPSQAQTIVIRAGRLLTGTTAPAIDNAVIVVTGDRIQEVGPATSITVPAAARVIDLSTDTVMPGLINGHQHPSVRAYFDVGAEAQREGRNTLLVQLNMMEEPPAMQAARAVRNLRIELLSGVTTAYVPGEMHFIDIHLKKAAAAGVFPAPRLYVSGPWLTSTGGYFPFSQTDGPWAMRAFVRKNVEAGAQHIKMVVNSDSGMRTGPNSVGRPFAETNMTKDEIEAAVDEAHRLGVKVTVHAGDLKSELLALNAGADSLQHASSLTPAILDLLVKNRAGIISTAGASQAAFTIKDYEYLDNEANSAADWVGRARTIMDRTRSKSPGASDTGRRQERYSQLRAARDRKVPIAVGNDNMVGLLHMNIYHLVEAGFTPLEALHAATAGGAKALGIDHEVGMLERGKFADIISIKGRPDQDIYELEKVNFVMVGGRNYTGLSFR